MDTAIINSDIMDVLAVSQQVDTAIAQLRQVRDLGLEHNRKCVASHVEDYNRIISGLTESSTDIRVLASDLLNEKIAAEAGKEVSDEEAGR